MKSVLALSAPDRREDRPPEFATAEDVTFTEGLVEAFLLEYTRPGDVVFDPFAGFGTTLVVAERLDRRPLGLEILPDRVEFIRSRLSDPTAIIEGDARQLGPLSLPLINFSISSPPYMTKDDHEQNPLSGYRTLDGRYSSYLRDLQSIYAQVADLVSAADGDGEVDPHARVSIVVNVANLRAQRTNLAWDVGTALAHVLTFEHEVIIDWDRPPGWLTHDYCLAFSARPVSAP